MNTPFGRFWVLTSLLFALALPRTAMATDFYVEGAISGGGSSWQADPNIGGTLHLGFEFLDIISVETLGRIGYSAVDERLLELLGVGAKAAIPIQPFTPFIRATAIHQHEMPVAVMGNDTFGHVMGVGDGIRHRFGIEGALGASITFAKYKKSLFMAEVEGYVDAFPDDRGPVVYGGASLGFGIQVGL